MNFSILAQLPVSMQVRDKKNPNIRTFMSKPKSRPPDRLFS